MKKYIIGSLLLVIIAVVMMKGMSFYSDKDHSSHVSAAIYGTDGILQVPPSQGLKGTAENPFIILEVVPYEGYAEIGYLIGGCEPVSTDDLAFDTNSAWSVQSTNTFNYTSGYEYKFELEEGDTVGEGGEDWKYMNDQTMAQYGYYERVENGTGNFIQKVTSQVVTEAPLGNGEYDKTNLYTKENTDTLYDTRVKFVPVTDETPANAIRYSPSVINDYSNKKFYTYDKKSNLYIFSNGQGNININFYRDDVQGRYTAEVIPANGYISWDDVMITYKKSDAYVPAFNSTGQPIGKYNINITKAAYAEAGEGNGNFIWVPNEDSKNITTNHNAGKIGDKVHTYLNRNYYRRMKYTLTNYNYFLKESLGIPENKINNYYTDSEGNSQPYNIQVITVTPKELNRIGNQPIIDRADLIYFSSKNHFNGDLTRVWEKYHPSKKLNNPPKELADIDLTWETTVKILKKAAISANPAPLIFDITVYTEISSAYKMHDSPAKFYSDGKPVDKNMLMADGYCSNIAKLFLMMEQMEPGKFYNDYIKTGLITSVPTKNANNKEVDEYGTPMTTGYYTEQTDKKSAVYWSIQTFLPYKLFKNYEELDNNKVWATIGIDNYRVIVDGQASNVSVRHNAYTYNGDNSMTQLFVDLRISENIYRKEAFDFYEARNGVRPDKISPAQAIFYLLNQQKTIYEKDTLRILEIEPCNDFIWDGSGEAWEAGRQNSNGSASARRYFTKLFPDFKGKVQITTITSSEFIGSKADLNSNYDMIFFGLEDDSFNKGVAFVNGVWMNDVPVYNDFLLNGKVYLPVGDKILGMKKLRGNLGGDNDKTDTYCFSGNDITKVKLNELLDYMDAGYPIVLDSGFYKDYSKKKVNNIKIDTASNLYTLARQTKSQLFYADGIATNKLEILLSELKVKLQLGKISAADPVEGNDYPVVYKDRTKSENADLTDNRIYINGSDPNYRTLQYKFHIDSATGTTFTVKLFIDNDGNDIFDGDSEGLEDITILSDDGNVVSADQLKENVNYTLNYNLEPEFYGILPWKLEIISNNNPGIRDSVNNYCAIKAGVKTDLNILQIKSEGNNTLDLSGNAKFLTYTANLKDYNLHITTWTADEFKQKCSNGAYQYILKDDEDNNSIIDESKKIQYIDDDGDGFYEIDMLILGFAHMYSDINSNNALQNMKDFMKEGKSVIFTHDTTSYINTSLSKYKQNGGTGSTYWGYKLNQTFRNILGMDRFGVTLPETGDNNKDHTGDIFKQGFTNILLSSNAQSDPIGDIINRYGVNKYINPGSNLNIETKYITNVNTGQITTYPYQIDKNFQIGTTHGQYYQLDMEEEDIVVWYCLSDEKSSVVNPVNGTDKGIYSSAPNDVRNNYYLYSKGNVTYSGLGHTAITSDMEMKLFVNTIITSYRATPKAPQIFITNSNKSTDGTGKDYLYVDYDIYDTAQAYGTEVIDGTAQLQKIKFQILDTNTLPNKELTVKYYEITENPEDGSVTETELTGIKTKNGSDEEVDEISSGEEYYIELPLTDLEMYNKGKEISIKVFLNFSNTYGNNSENTMTAIKEFTLFRRGLFDLD